MEGSIRFPPFSWPMYSNFTVEIVKRLHEFEEIHKRMREFEEGKGKGIYKGKAGEVTMNRKEENY
jgi:hypothetical protein